MCDYGYRSIGQLDCQQSIPDPKRVNVISTPQTFIFGPQFLVIQTQTFINENFCFPGQVQRFRFLILSLFLFEKILWMSLRRFNLTMTFFDEPLEGKRWQSSTKVGSIGTSVSFYDFQDFWFKVFVTNTCRNTRNYSLLEYYSLA